MGLAKGFEARRRWVWEKAWAFDALLLVVAGLTQWVLWLNDEQTLPADSLRLLWRSAHAPQSVFEGLIAPVASCEGCVVALMGAMSMGTLWGFYRVSRALGWSSGVSFVLFLLLNFNPEYNDVRLNVDGFQGVMLLWVWALWLWVRFEGRWGIFLGLLTMGLAVWIDGLAWVWLLGLPLCAGCFFKRRVMLGYYLMLALVVLGSLPLWGSLSGLGREVWGAWVQIQFAQAQAVVWSGVDAWGLALAMALLKLVKMMGWVIVLLVGLGFGYGKSVLAMRWRMFLLGILGLAVLQGALGVLVFGAEQQDLQLMLAVMGVLWLHGSAVFYGINRWREGQMAVQWRLMLVWLAVSYALASVATFGPSMGYKREAGLWAQAQGVARVVSDDAQVLFYAGRSPFVEEGDLLLGGVEDWQLGVEDLLLYTVHRHAKEAVELEGFTLLRTFNNRHGDKVLALQLRRNEG